MKKFNIMFLLFKYKNMQPKEYNILPYSICMYKYAYVFYLYVERIDIHERVCLTAASEHGAKNAK